jgi:hypothetical protein
MMPGYSEGGRELWQRASPWLSLFVVALLFELPTIVRPGGIRVGVMRPTGEVLVILTLGALSYRFAWGRVVRSLLVLATIVYAVVRLDHVIFWSLMRKEPLLYDQWYMLRHLFVLIGDLGSAAIWSTLGGIVALGLVVWLVVRLLRRARELLNTERAPSTARIAFFGWLAMLLASSSHVVGVTKKPVVQWMTPALAENVVESRSTYASLKKLATRSPYDKLRDIQLTRRPDVILLLVESYGRMLFDHNDTRDLIDARLTEMQSQLAAAGWYGASAFSRAPVSGGRSWLAAGSMIMGIPIRYEVTFDALLPLIPKMATLHALLGGQGYRTTIIAPADRPRIGVKQVKQYDVDAYLDMAGIGYNGRPIGWGWVPDQYTLGFVRDRVLASAVDPQYVEVRLVSSHAPWSEPPEVVADWTELGVASDAPALKELEAEELIRRKVRAYTYKTDKHRYVGRLRGQLLGQYVTTVDYSLQTVADFVEDLSRDSLVIAIGDHQPPLVARENESFDAPIHLLTKNAQLHRSLVELGFRDGLEPEGRALMSHSGVLSLIMHALEACCSDQQPQHPWLRHGHTSSG